MNRFRALLEKKIKELQAARVEAVCYGQVENFGLYKESVGYLSALKTVLELCEESESEINRGA